MKKFYYLVGLSLTTCLMAGCGSSKNVVQQPQLMEEVEINIPCSGPEFVTSTDYFRANANGLSTDMSTAKKKAMSNARSELATAINGKVERVLDDYTSSYQSGENDDTKKRFQDLSRTVVNQQLSGIRVICEKTMRTSDGKYRVYVALELAGDEIAKAMGDRIKNDDRLRIDFEYEKFKKVFDEEMKKQ